MIRQSADEELALEVERFRTWASGHAGSYGEWECDYPGWEKLYDATRGVLALPRVSAESVQRLLYVLARDNECEIVLAELDEHRETGMVMARAAWVDSESDARWQLAVFLGAQDDEESRALLRRYVHDADEYVRRRALLACVEHDAAFAQAVALERLSDAFEYSRLAALSVLQQTHSPQLAHALVVLRDDPSEVVQAALKQIVI